MRRYMIIAAIGGCLIFFLTFSKHDNPVHTGGVRHTLFYIKKHIALFDSSTSTLQRKLIEIRKNDPQSIQDAKEALEGCRMQYKSIEFFLTYFFRSDARVYNDQPNFEVEQPFYEYEAPSGFQIIESILFSKNPFWQRDDLVKQGDLIKSSSDDIYSLLYNMKITDQKILESVRLGLIRLIALGITGYDAPELKTGISESAQVIKTVKVILEPFLIQKFKEADSVKFYLNASLKLLQNHPNFDSFNRLYFLTSAALPLQYHLGLLIKKEGLELNSTGGIINYNAKNLFSPNALHINPEANPDNLPLLPTDSSLMGPNANPAVISLGKKLFFESALSADYMRSCASCHQPENYFTNHLPKVKTLNNTSTVKRNTPTLLYVRYQYSQFWDGRAKSLQDQIRTVLNDSLEMGFKDEKIIVKRLRGSKQYFKYFREAFPNDKDSVINIGNVIISISAFLKTLAPFDSPFDRYMQGDKKALSRQQKKGFNLFMGKAQCAACHTVPLFNGLLPPFYDMTELENLGVTKDTDFGHPELDADSGRFAATPAKYYMRKFKTPTLRNIAKTAPYMHNGAFPTLKKVLQFYNKGGGEGLGLNVPDQTLSPKPLQLTDSEMNDIIVFLNALSDTQSSLKKR